MSIIFNLNSEEKSYNNILLYNTFVSACERRDAVDRSERQSDRTGHKCSAPVGAGYVVEPASFGASGSTGAGAHGFHQRAVQDCWKIIVI